MKTLYNRRTLKMMKNFMLAIVLCTGIALPSFAQEKAKLPKKEDFWIVMLAGQSNMSGRGTVKDEDKVPHERVLMMNKAGDWVPAVDPMHFDRGSCGVGPGRTFANLLAEANPGITVGLVPTAVGASYIDDWKPGAVSKATQIKAYDDAVQRMEKALKDGTLKVILWHQGEADSGDYKLWDSYKDKLVALMKDFRSKFNSADCPVVVGEIPQPKPVSVIGPGSQKHIKDASIAAVAEMGNAAFASSEEITAMQEDHIHFTRESQIEMGKRYFEAYKKLMKK